MRLTKQLFILFLALWLPASVVVAGNMAASMSGPAQQMQSGAAEGCPQHAPEQGADRGAGDCYGCSFCQFACTALMTVPSPALHFVGGWIAASLSAPAPRPFFPDRLQRPPLAS